MNRSRSNRTVQPVPEFAARHGAVIRQRPRSARLISKGIRLPVLLLLTGVVLVAAASLPTSAAPLIDAAQRSAELTPLAQRAALEAISRAGSRLVAVGERGIVILSDDEGRHWRQVQSPVSVTLTSIVFVDATHGWAAGHAGVVLHSDDGGEHWVTQLDGERAARLALSEVSLAGAQASPAASASNGMGASVRSAPTAVLANAKRLVSEGADKPFLSVDFSDAQHGTVVGAYGLAVHTDDGGRSWQSWTARIGDVRGLHLYAVKQRGASVWVVGEQGFVAHSTDGGATFATVRMPYAGSFFALDIGVDQTVVLGGLRGHLYRLRKGDASFAPVALDSSAMITNVRFSDAGTCRVVNQAGEVWVSRDHAMTFKRSAANSQSPLNGIVENPDASVVGVGFEGVEIFPASNEDASTRPFQATIASGAKP